MPNFTSCIQLRSRSVVTYNKFERRAAQTGNGSFMRTDAQIQSDKKLTEQETYSGKLTDGGRKRLTKSIELLTQAAFKHKKYSYTPKGSLKEVTAKFKLNFITLTIHSPKKMIDGKEGHKLALEPLLKWLRDHYGLSLYVWKAELQERGQLHYHITSNCFVPWRELWAKWGELNERAGYLDDWFKVNDLYKTDDRGMIVKNYPVRLSDIHSVHTIRDMASYLKKCVAKSQKKKDGSIISEFTKEVQNAAQIGGKVWDCSINLKSAKYYTIDCGGSVADEQLHNINIQAKRERAERVSNDHCTILKFEKDAYKLLDTFWQQDYFDALTKMINYQRRPPKRKQPCEIKPPPKVLQQTITNNLVPVIEFKKEIDLFSELTNYQNIVNSQPIYAN